MLLILSGWPASGKGYYSKWLQAHRDFRHLDVEKPVFQESSLCEVLNESIRRGQAEAFIEHLHSLHPRWVMDWGFPPSCLPIIRQLRQAGGITWHLVPETAEISRAEWLRRERENNPDRSLTGWQEQTDRLRSAGAELREFFGDHILQVLDADGKRMPPEEFVARIGLHLPD